MLEGMRIKTSALRRTYQTITFSESQIPLQSLSRKRAKAIQQGEMDEMTGQTDKILVIFAPEEGQALQTKELDAILYSPPHPRST